MHPQAFEYVAAALLAHADPRPRRVVEFGSFDVNGSPRPLLADAEEYLGLDTREGKGVDKVIDAGRWNGKGEYDLVVTTETLEHAERPQSVIAAAHKALKAGGLLIATMAAPERTPHSVDGSPRMPAGQHYANISEAELREWLAEGWTILDLQHHPDRGDLYVTARKKRERAAKKEGE
jgi:SAM-dependent methyltransferase